VRRILATLAIAASALVVGVTPALAITKNFVPDLDHPFVGLVAFYDEAGEFSHRCSGSLLTDRVFLTAGHCTDGVASARVWFQQDAGAEFNGTIDPTTGYPDTCAPDPANCRTSDELYNYGFDNFAGFPNHRDVGLVILDAPFDPGEFASLAGDGTLTDLATARGTKDVTFTVSGYGVTYRDPVHFVSFRSRLMAKSTLVNLLSALNDGYNLQTNGNGDVRGGTCGGDSGGPVFYSASSNRIVAVTSFGLNAWCRGTDFAYRTDRDAVIDWILGTVPASEADDIVID